MPNGKPAGVRCHQLSSDNRCLLFGKPERPAVCLSLQPLEEMCGQTTEEAQVYLEFLERRTTPLFPALQASEKITDLKRSTCLKQAIPELTGGL